MKYFTIAELCKSNIADRNGINNRCRKEHVANLTALVKHILDPLREAYGKPIFVNSGYRSPVLNRAVGGSAVSDHLYGRAADITTGDKAENKKLFNLILSLRLPFDQLIDEKDLSWIHVSYRSPDKNRKQVLKL